MRERLTTLCSKDRAVSARLLQFHRRRPRVICVYRLRRATMKRAKYEKELGKLQVRLCHLQRWVKETGLRVVVVFEGRAGAGKGGQIRATPERRSPRVFKVVALPAPSDREKSQVYMQRYLQHFPAAGEVVIFDRSWYNRAGVEYVMGFCSEKEHERFLELCQQIAQFLIGGGGRAHTPCVV